MSATRRPVRILVCGNEDRCDDGAAQWAVEHLPLGAATDGQSTLSIVQCGHLDVQDLLDGTDGARVLIVDTAVGVEPGTVVTLDFDTLLAHPRQVAPHSSHALPIDQVIGIAREISATPIDGLFVGIGASDVGYGHDLSRPVRESMGEFVIAVQRAVMRLSAGGTHVH